MSFFLGLEIFAVLTSLAFLILLIRQNIWCWLFGIISSLASIYLFYSTKLYSESILYFYYVIIGIYGWNVWSKGKPPKEIIIKTVSGTFHLILIFSGIILSILLGYFFKTQTDAERSFADAFSTIFSFLASYLEVHKILSAWIFWMIINAFSVWLYYDRGLIIYAALMLVYFSLSITGYLQWKKELVVQ